MSNDRMPTIADALGGFAASLRPDDIPEPVRERARHLILDAVGRFLDRDVKPHVHHLEHDDIYPEDWASIGASHSDVGGYAGGDASSFDADPLFTAMPAFFDRSVAAAADASSVVVASGAGYAPGDVLEIGKDGVARTVSNVAGGTVTFAPPLALAAAKGTQIRNWDMAIGTQNAHLKAGSPCINVGTPVNAPAKDLEGNGRVGLPDLGVYEHP